MVLCARKQLVHLAIAMRSADDDKIYVSMLMPHSPRR